MGTTKYEKAYCTFFKDKYKDIAKMQEGWTHQVLANKKLRTPYGLEFYWPDTTCSKFGYITNTTSIYNYAIQGMATAEIIPAVLVSIWKKLRGMDARIVLTVHDSIIIEHSPDIDGKLFYQMIAESFTRDAYDYMSSVYGYEMVVALGCEIKTGESWGTGKGFKYKMFPTENVLIKQ